MLGYFNVYVVAKGRGRYVMLTLRAHLALAGRCARRLFPALAADIGLATQCDTGIVMAEAFALGEPGPHARARTIARDLKEIRIENLDPRPAAALQAAIQAALAAENAFSAVTRTPPARPCAQAAHDAAEMAIAASLSDSLGSDDHNRLRASHEGDLRELATDPDEFTTDEVRDLGPPVDLSRHGILGSLWRTAEPEWFRDGLARWRRRFGNPSPLVVCEDKLDQVPEPDVVVFHFAGGTLLEDLIGRIDRTRSRLAKGRGLPPTLFVYAPGLAEPDQLRLARRGIIVDGGGPNGMIPSGAADGEAVKRGLDEWFAESYADWRITDGGMTYKGARATWWTDRLAPLPPPPTHWPPEKAAPLAPRDDYTRLVDFLNGRTDSELKS